MDNNYSRDLSSSVPEEDARTSLRYRAFIRAIEKEALSVGCVQLTADSSTDTYTEYRLSSRLRNLIPGWEEEPLFCRRSEMLERLICPEDLDRFREETLRAHILERLQVSHYCTSVFRADSGNGPEYFRIRFSRIREDGEIRRFGVELHSVDKRVRREKEERDQLMDAREKAESARRAKASFLFNMSHDIRTPMNAVLGFADMGLKYLDDRDKVEDCLRKIRQSGSMLLSLMNDVLDMSRIESESFVPAEDPGDAYLSFISIEPTLQEMAANAGVALSFSFGPITDRYIYADFSHTGRILINLITNAVKFNRPGGWVSVRCEQIGLKDGYALFRYTVADNGIGMSPEFRELCFDEFSRENSVTVSGIPGVGLGLAVCRAYTEQLKGTITCESEQGSGSVFTLELPFRLQEGQVYTDPDSGRQVSREAPPFLPEEISLQGKRVLLVEDNELNREIADDILSEMGLTVESAGDGAAAVDLLRKKGSEYYDFVLMDIQMPVMDGLQAARVIRAMYPNARLPILALSANTFPEDRAKSIAAGMNDHLNKPIQPDLLRKALSYYLK